jgi:inner membrane protein
MPSLLGHAAAGLAITSAFHRDKLPRRTWGLAAFCAMAPDFDWFVSLLPLHRGHFLNHRGVTHSLFAAVLLAAVVYFIAFRPHQRRGAVWLCLTVAALSHGLLDACTSGGVGVALFMPFSETRWACIWQPGHVAPLPRGADTWAFLSSIWSEAMWIGMPAVVVSAWSRLMRQVSLRPSLSEAVPENL